ILVEGLKPSCAYAYQIDGSDTPGNHFRPQKVLLDPYARDVDVRHHDRSLACQENNKHYAGPRGLISKSNRFDWGHDHRPHHPPQRSVIYELHLKGITAHPSSGVDHPGTFAGLTEKLPYFAELGVTTLQLMPIQAFDNDQSYHGRQNYWGYSQLSFFALQPTYFAHPHYSSEFKKFVKRAHEFNLEVILDVVYNHTTEANEQGPTLSWRGIDNQNYYLLPPAAKNYYLNYSGCGNTFNANSQAGSQLIIDSLEYLAQEFHLDGFRFDLGGTFYYQHQGYLDKPKICALINRSPILRQLKLIAEPWDATGLVLEGRFGGPKWFEWSSTWQNLVRQSVNFNQETAAMEQYLKHGHPAFLHHHKNPELAVNYVASHDGFTLRDVVSYQNKHNQDNGFDNQDGSNQNFSHHYGYEGEANDPGLTYHRQRQALKMLELTSQAPGMMMISMGDEMWRTLYGNNNAFNQDTPNNYLDWNLLTSYRDYYDQVRSLLHRKSQR
ncbi:glycogen debranching enzyme, partial [bacterium]|nr:glycogen debranching enzyme [bacterium]